MVSHWESSQRPLFIKTVWRNGYHHVVLTGSEKCETPPPPKTRISTSRSCNSERGTKTSVVTNSDRLEIPSVKLFLRSVKIFKDSYKTRRIKSCGAQGDFTETWTVDVPPGDTLKCRNINEEVIFTHKNLIVETSSSNKARRLPVKFNSVDVNSKHINECAISCENCHLLSSNFTCENDRFANNPLSERVMVWLDLATQNGDFNYNFVPYDPKTDIKKRVVTAHALPVTTKKQLPNTKLCRSTNYKCQQEMNLRQAPTVRETENNQNMINESVLKTNAIVPKRNPAECDLKPVVSRLETSTEERMNADNSRKINVKCDASRRQLHIFIPRLPKRTSHCDSILSSKSSSLHQKIVT